MTMVETLKQAIADSELNYYQLGKATGVERASIMRFCQGKHVLRFDKAAAVAEFLGLELKPKRRTRKGR